MIHLISDDFSGLSLQSDVAVIAEIDRLSPYKSWRESLYPMKDTGVLNPAFVDKKGDFNYQIFIEKLFN